MRLLEVNACGELGLTKNFIEDIPRYAILSHTWGADKDEVTFNDLENGSGKSKTGYAKLQFCREQAEKDGLQYFWVDTCCINKANNTELSEAITSMFRWYHEAVKCYVYLSDVSVRKRNNSGQTEPTWEFSISEKQMVHTGLDSSRTNCSAISRVLFARRRAGLSNKSMHSSGRFTR